MKQDNVFNFVAIRGPERPVSTPPDQPVPGSTVPPDSSVPIPIESDDDTFVTDIRRRTDSGIPIEAAREGVARELFASEDYVPRSRNWRDLLELEVPLSRVLTDGIKTPDATTVRAALERVLSRHFGQHFSIGEFVKGDEFRKKRMELWNSYYANVTLGNTRLQDRPLLEFWIRLFEVLRNLADDCQQARLPDFRRMRPTIPLVLVRQKKAEVTKPDEPTPGPNRLADIRDAQASLADLKAAEQELKRIYEASLEEPPAQSSKPASKTGSFAAIDDSAAAWKLRESDLSEAVRQTLAREYIAIKDRTLPAIIDAVQKKVATTYLRLHGLQRTTEVVLSGGVFVRRRRRIPLDRN